MAGLPTIAKKAVKRIEAKLECSICLESFKEPKLLPCFHVFCKSPCLEKLVGPGGDSLVCPTCRHRVTLPNNGVAGLQTDFHIEHLFEIREDLEQAKSTKMCQNCSLKTANVKYCQQCRKVMCVKCIAIHAQWDDFKTHSIVDIKSDDTSKVALKSVEQRSITTCKKHSQAEAKIFCETCSELICSDCTVSIHKDHDFSLVDDVTQRFRKELDSSLKLLKVKLDTIDEALRKFDTRAKELNDRKTTIESSIKLKYDCLQRQLEQQKAELMNDLELMVNQKMTQLISQRNEVQLTHTKIKEFLEYVEKFLQAEAKSKMLQMKTTVLKQIEQISTEFDTKSLQLHTEADIELVATGVNMIGEIACDPVSTENSYATGNGTVFAIAQYQSSVEVNAISIKGKKKEGNINVCADLVHIKTGATLKCDSRLENSHYKITYRPIIRGQHCLHIKINGQPILGSPYFISVIPSLENLRKPSMIVQEMSSPQSVAINSKRQVLVIEQSRKRCITVLTLGGKKLFSFGSRGPGIEQFETPCGIAVDQNDNIYVSDQNNHRILKFTQDGKFCDAVGSHGNESLKFNSPCGLCFDKMLQNLYVCDQLNNRIQVLSRDLKLVACFGTGGSEIGHFQSPMNICFDKSNHLYVTDYGNNRIQVFTAEGEYLRSFNSKSNGERLQHPYGISIDSSNTVYVSESGRNSVSLFTCRGEHITSFGSKGSTEGWFHSIRGLCIDQNDHIFVSDHKNNRLQVF